VTSTGEKGNACRGLAEKVEGRRPLGISRRRKEDKFETDLKEIRQRVWTGFIWFMYGQKLGTCENGKKSLVSLKCGERA
jgi:hypothetical protein